MDRNTMTKTVYQMLDLLPQYNHLIDFRLLPPNGIYIFYEAGERCRLDGKIVNRIVRIGTHKSEGRFRGRIRQHYGSIKSMSGNKNSSVFRKHVGGALMNRDIPGDCRLKDWNTQDGPTFADIEEMVSQELKSRFTFACFQVDTKEDRLSLESGLIALLSQYPVGNPSPQWLGHHAVHPNIKESGLWNTQHIHSDPLAEEQLDQIAICIRRR